MYKSNLPLKICRLSLKTVITILKVATNKNTSENVKPVKRLNMTVSLTLSQDKVFTETSPF